MIEIGIGLLALLAAGAAALGFAGHLIPIPLGIGSAGLIALAGILLVCHGAFRQILKRKGTDRHWLRTKGLTITMLLALFVFAFVLPAGVAFLNAFQISGLPLGYYLAAQGSLIAMVMMLFMFASRADAIDVDEGASE